METIALIKEQLDIIVDLYFVGYTVAEALEMVKMNE